MTVNVCEAYRGMIKEVINVPEEKYSIEYTYELTNPQTQKKEMKTGNVTFTVPVGVTVKVGTPKKVA